VLHNPKYFRARISAIHHFISQSSEIKEKNSPHELLKYGVIHPSISNEFEKQVSKTITDYTFSELPLTFTEKTSFNTWFAMHPEKIAGEEIITTSREFPISIKGTKEDIIRVIGKTVAKENNTNRIRIAKAKSIAKIKLLKLLK